MGEKFPNYFILNPESYRDSVVVPEDFLEMAHDIRNKYNNKSNTFNQNGLIIEKKTSQYKRTKIKGVCEICKESEGTEVHHLIYQKEFENGNSKGNKLKKNHKANLINICEK